MQGPVAGAWPQPYQVWDASEQLRGLLSQKLHIPVCGRRTAPGLRYQLETGPRNKQREDEQAPPHRAWQQRETSQGQAAGGTGEEARSGSAPPQAAGPGGKTKHFNLSNFSREVAARTPRDWDAAEAGWEEAGPKRPSASDLPGGRGAARSGLWGTQAKASMKQVKRGTVWAGEGMPWAEAGVGSYVAGPRKEVLWLFHFLGHAEGNSKCWGPQRSGGG